jgi:hypothetical protein
MFSYHTLNLLAEARRADMLREAQPQLRPVVPKRKWGSILSCITLGSRRRRCDDSVSVVAADRAAGSAPTIPSSDPSS